MLSLKSESLTIGDVEFSTQQFPAMRSLEVLTKLIKVAGPAMATLSSLDPKTELSAAVPQLMAALQGLEPKEAHNLVLELFAMTTALVRAPSGSKILTLNKQENIDQVFSGNIRNMFTVLGHSISVNYGDFFGGIDPALPANPETSQKASE